MKQAKCSRCDSAKPLTEFYKNSANGLGRTYECKACYRTYEATPERRAKRTWNTLPFRVRLQAAYKGIEIRMERDAFLKWAIPAYTKWMLANPTETPSLDRIDPSKHYELGNLRILARGDNARLARNHPNVHAPAGMAWCHGCLAYLQKESFWRSSSHFNGLQKRCKQCQTEAIRLSKLRARRRTVASRQ